MTDVSVDPTSTIGAARESGAQFVPRVRDYIDLLKPRVMSLVVFTALVGMLAAPGEVHPFLGFAAILAIAVGAGASGALNMWYDADIDARMRRTRTRPLPAKRLAPSEALTFGVVLSVLSVLTMALAVNYFAAALLALTIAFYVFVYTMWLKRSTPQNIVIGGAAGAFPPMIGWAAVTGSVSLESIVLFLIIFLWTPPHFWALALYRCSDYADVGVPMLPVVAGKRATRRQILLYTLALVPVTLSPLALGLGGWLYGATAVVANLGLLALAVRIWLLGEGKLEGGRDAEAVAKHMFAYSILYLFALFAALFVEHL